MTTDHIDAGTVIDRLGGPKAVQEMTGLTKGRISQWRTENHIPKSWRKYLQEKFPKAFLGDEAVGENEVGAT